MNAKRVGQRIWGWIRRWGREALRITPFKSGLLTVATMIALFALQQHRITPLVSRLDIRILDWMFWVRGTTEASDQIVIVDIDERSLYELGQWPWPRTQVAGLIRAINDCEPLIIGVDAFFPEEDRTSPEKFLPFFREHTEGTITIPEQALNNDIVLGDTIAEAPVVLGFFLVMDQDEVPAGANLPFPAHCRILPAEPAPADLGYLDAHRAVGNIPEICQDSLTEGFVNTLPDLSGGIRTVPLVMSCARREYWSLATEMLRFGLDLDENVKVRLDNEMRIRAIDFGDRRVLTDVHGRVSVNWRGRRMTFRYLSAVDVLRGRISADHIRGKYVLIGTSAGGLHDLRTTPLEERLPGVEIHATVIDNILNMDFLRNDPLESVGYVVMFVTVAGVLLSALLAWTAPIVGAVGGLAAMVVAVMGNYYLFTTQNIFAGVVYPLVSCVAVFLIVSLVNYFSEGREKLFIRKAFGHYVSEDVVSTLVQDPKRLSLAGEEKELSVMFSDIRGFTSLSEGMTAVQLSMFLNEYLSAMTDIIMEHSGTVDKFIGDCIVAIWGAPLDDDAHAVNAVNAGMAMLERLEVLRQEWHHRGLPPIFVGVGVNTGVMNVGNMGSRTRFDYTVIGDNVNLASRLEGLNKVYGTSMLVTQTTKQATGIRYYYRFVDKVVVKGRSEAVPIYEPKGRGLPSTQFLEEQQRYDQALEAYYGRDFTVAKELFEELLADREDSVYQYHLTNIENYLVEPPPVDWDGTTTHKSK